MALGTPRWVRILVPAILILIWLTTAAIGGPYFGRVGEVATNDQAAFLPASAEATVVEETYPRFVGEDSIPAIVVVKSETQLSEAELGDLQAVIDETAALEAVDEVSPAIPSDDGLAAQAFVFIDADGDIDEVVDQLREHLAAGAPEGVETFVTGPAGFTADLVVAFAGIDGLLLVVALAAVFVILLFVYRSILLPLIVLATSTFALCGALLLNWWLAKWGVVEFSGQTQGILFILVIGAATDYAILYTARYSEELKRYRSSWTATHKAMRGVLEPILASGGTVIAGLMCLLLSDLGSNRSLGPVASIGIVFAICSALTFLPAVMLLIGRGAFWPRRPNYDPEFVASSMKPGVYATAGKAVAAKPRLIWILCTLALAAGAAFVPTLKADGVPPSEFVLGSSNARDGQNALAEHFPGGSGSPAQVLTAQDNLEEVAGILLSSAGIDSVAVLSRDSPSGSAPVTADGIQPVGPPGTPAPEPTLVDGEVLLEATLTDKADSTEAVDTVRQLRTDLGDLALVGGVTAVDIDTQDTSIRDRNLIIPIVLVVILIILMGLLRSVLAPVLLIATTILSFGTAMGTAALVFNHVFEFPGADASVPLFGFVFLVALGIDYNIFLTTRVREEALTHGTREGIIRGLAVTGGVITSAGIVLAATFAALAVIPILFLAQIAFIVAFGVLLDTFLVRTLLVPALMYDIGPKVWWPNRLPADRSSNGELATKGADPK